jgi:predicted nucleic acid-binding protein
MTLTDTGPLVALNNRNDAAFDKCRRILPTLRPPWVTTWPCFTEAMYLLGKVIGYPAQKELWSMVTDGILTLHSLTKSDWERMRLLMDQYRDAPMDLADASLVVAAETLGVQSIFTLDKHFYAYRLADSQAFQVVP